MPTIVSPNGVLANALLYTHDLLRPRIFLARPSRIKFVVGTQINGPPHIGTSLVQASAFAIAQVARQVFALPTSVTFGALDNAPSKVVTSPESFHVYQKTLHHDIGVEGVNETVRQYYGEYIHALSDITGVEHDIH